jgi:hypothetical protein
MPSYCQNSFFRVAPDWLCRTTESTRGCPLPECSEDPGGARPIEYASRKSLYKAFEPAEARRILDKLEFHFTPKHGSWLNMAEIELSVLARQCLDRRIPDQKSLRHEVNVWQQSRNVQHHTVDWQFTTADAWHMTIAAS